MSWITLKLAGGRLKIKPRWQQRWAERRRLVRVFNLGALLIVWWSDADIKKYR